MNAIDKNLYITFQGIVKSSGEPFVVLGAETAIPVIQSGTSYVVDPAAENYIALNDLLKQFQDDMTGAIKNVFISGYYNEADQKFYEDSGFQTAITGNSIFFYIDISTNRLYRYNGSAFLLVAGTQIQVDWNETDSESEAFIKNKPTNVSAFLNDENYVSQSEMETYLGQNYTDNNDLASIYATIEYVNGKVSAIYKIKGSVPSYADLDTDLTEKVEGNVYNVTETGKNYVYVSNVNGTEEAGWDDIGATVDLTPLTDRISSLESWKATIPTPSTENSGKILGVNSAGSYTFVNQYSYSLPIATSSSLGGVQPVAKTSAMTQEVGVDASGALFTTPAVGDAQSAFERANLAFNQANSAYDAANTVSESVSSLSGTVSSQGTTISELNSTISNLSSNISAAESLISSANSAVTALNGTVESLSDTVTSHSGTISTLSGSISNIQNDVSTLNTTVGRIQISLDQMNTTIAEKQNTLTAGTGISISGNVISTTLTVPQRVGGTFNCVGAGANAGYVEYINGALAAFEGTGNFENVHSVYVKIAPSSAISGNYITLLEMDNRSGIYKPNPDLVFDYSVV